MYHKYNNPIIIAEIGCNHQGSIEKAVSLITSAKKSGAHYAKFQKRDNKYLLGKDFDKAHPNPINSFGESYGLHREFLEFNMEQHKFLYDKCLENEIGYTTSVWDINSAKEFIKCGRKIDFLKVPSACNEDLELLSILADEFDGDIHISTGMTEFHEIEKIIEFFIKKNRTQSLVVYSCTSSYPCRFEDIHLLQIIKIKNEFSKIIKDIGFSGHHLGIAVDIAAFTLGANFIERHFTLDRTLKGTDHAASLEPSGLTKLTRDLSVVKLSMSEKNNLADEEMVQKNKLKKIRSL